MNYVVIRSADQGATWQLWNGVGYPTPDAALVELRAASAIHPAHVFNMHCLHPHLLAAFAAPPLMPHEPFF